MYIIYKTGRYNFVLSYTLTLYGVVLIRYFCWYLFDIFSFPILRVPHHRYISLIMLIHITGNMGRDVYLDVYGM